MKTLKSIFSIASVLLFCGTTFAEIIHVPGDQPTIQAGIDSAQIGDTVLVAPGTYYENLVIYKAISLLGEDRDSTVIDGSEGGDVVFIEANRVYITKFTIRSSLNNLGNKGIKIGFVDSCTIEFCKVHDNHYGLGLYGSCNNFITRCHFISNRNGIYFGESYAGPIRDNQDNLIQNNIFNGNTNCGILLVHTTDIHHQNNVISGNTISNNGTGISMIMSHENDISFNDIINNTGYGIELWMCMGGGQFNEFHHNNFYSNNGGLVQASDFGGGTDYWYSEESQEGNYWSDYTGTDNDGDGIGDDPYTIDGDESQDLYPLMEPLFAVLEGVVTNENSEPIAGVYVVASGTSIDDSTNLNGGYTLDSLGTGIYDVSFSHLGYSDTTILGVATTPGHISTLNVMMSVFTYINVEKKRIPNNFILSQNYPNPFNPTTAFQFGLPKPANVTLKVFNLLGQEVITLVDEHKSAGYHQARWDVPQSGIGSGVYFYRIQAGEFMKVKKCLLVK